MDDLALDLSRRSSSNVSAGGSGIVGGGCASFPAAVLFAAPSLTALDLSHRGLLELPDALGCLTRLAYLGVAGNRLTALPTAALARLERLEELHADDNDLAAGCSPNNSDNNDTTAAKSFPLPLSCLRPLSRLRVLGLSRNGLRASDLPFGLATALPELVELRI